ncbi:hypothetical protein DL96DRAFT_1705972 [Flagelloscypha sp. PMI_526]|nr:hypothetical protein DL96DRAFT_1705972 [Flagelloscypha sp. PMI_526]
MTSLPTYLSIPFGNGGPVSKPFPSDRGVRLLSIDADYSERAGAYAAISSIDNIMAQVAADEGVSKDDIEPWKYFDIIAGSGEGGLIALMLGRLKMKPHQILEHYITIRQKLYANPDLWNAGTPSTVLKARLESAVKDIVIASTRDSDGDLLNRGHLDGCRTFILGSRPGTYAPNIFFRSYPAPSQSPRTFNGPIQTRTWQAAYVTMAGHKFPPTPIPIVKPAIDQYVGVGLDENPVKVLAAEAQMIWPGANIACIVSIGTGVFEFPDSTKVYRDVVHEEMSNRLGPQLFTASTDSLTRASMSDVYFRFNVHGMDEYLNGQVDGSEREQIHVKVSKYLDTETQLLQTLSKRL